MSDSVTAQIEAPVYGKRVPGGEILKRRMRAGRKKQKRAMKRDLNTS